MNKRNEVFFSVCNFVRFIIFLEMSKTKQTRNYLDLCHWPYEKKKKTNSMPNDNAFLQLNLWHFLTAHKRIFYKFYSFSIIQLDNFISQSCRWPRKKKSSLKTSYSHSLLADKEHIKMNRKNTRSYLRWQKKKHIPKVSQAET